MSPKVKIIKIKLGRYFLGYFLPSCASCCTFPHGLCISYIPILFPENMIFKWGMATSKGTVDFLLLFEKI